MQVKIPDFIGYSFVYDGELMDVEENNPAKVSKYVDDWWMQRHEEEPVGVYKDSCTIVAVYDHPDFGRIAIEHMEYFLKCEICEEERHY